ncbi:hypothetical protein [Mesorhizobium mediterraneum]|uniref:hypothetical protein n=1 Tax=Mesorhizobium mediterraneum TaxID=43617 RepID=UPI00178625F3|nr:hypothetical protein [Mesorhizobium mediterraneum]
MLWIQQFGIRFCRTQTDACLRQLRMPVPPEAPFKQKPAPVSGAGLLPEAELNTCPQQQGRLAMLKIWLIGHIDSNPAVDIRLWVNRNGRSLSEAGKRRIHD